MHLRFKGFEAVIIFSKIPLCIARYLYSLNQSAKPEGHSCMTNEDYLPLDHGMIPQPGETEADYWFVFHDQTLLVAQDATTPAIPRSRDIGNLRSRLHKSHYLGSLRGTSCRAAIIDSNESSPGGFRFVELRELLHLLHEELFLMAGRALQIVNWATNHRFCGRCGMPTIEQQKERAMRCPACGYSSFPRLSPAIIVAIVRDGRLLLALHARTKNGMRTVLAGYLEPGESFESCVKREVFEEVRLRLDNIRYFGSQPWPFPDALMVAFTANYVSGEIAANGVEILEAAWYGPDEIPEKIPGRNTVSRKLIDWFVGKYGERRIDRL
jgi:NAD+ diphosphatase